MPEKVGYSYQNIFLASGCKNNIVEDILMLMCLKKIMNK